MCCDDQLKPQAFLSRSYNIGFEDVSSMPHWTALTYELKMEPYNERTNIHRLG